ncbi:hypothetical protein EON76_04520 [bacterium]|nr:MAG: hypothetical protein EON76_04520 [bacterium]
MIHFDQDAPNSRLQPLLQRHIEQFDNDVRKLLPSLPSTIHIWLDNSQLIDATGEGGFAYSPDTITISFNPNFIDKQLQLQQLRGTIFHESYHLIQGHTYEDPHAVYTSALDSAIYEGCATVFERTHAGSNPLWGHYSQYDTETLNKWRDQLAAISISDYTSLNTKLWQTWAHYDVLDQQQWKAYKVGTWLVDGYLSSKNVSITDMCRYTAKDIYTHSL